MNKRIRNSNLKCPKIADNLSRILFKYKYLQMFIKEKLRTYTLMKSTTNVIRLKEDDLFHTMMNWA